MSTSRKSKKDIDRYVRQIDEKERNGRGYQIALLYYEVGEYDLAKRYLAGYISLRETVPQGHKLMGQIYEASRELEQAASCYKRSLELDAKQKDLVLKVCELYNSIPDMDIERLKYWSERAEKLYPNNKVVFSIKEKILKTGNGGTVEEMEEFYGAQLVKNFANVSLHIKLLELYMNAERAEDAYNHVLGVENSLAFVNNLEWNEYLPKVFHAYQKKVQCNNNLTFHRSKLFVLCNLLKLQLQDKDISVCASTLHEFDQALFEAYQINSKKPEWMAVASEMQGQYFFFMAVLILKRAQKGQQSWKDASSFSGICFLLSNSFQAMETKSTWFVQLKQEDSRFYEKLQKMGCYRLSQGGHMLSAITQNNGPAKVQHLKQNLRTIPARDKLYEILFTHRDMREKKDRSYLSRTDVYCKTPLLAPSQSAILEWDNVVHHDCIQNLHEHVWIALNRYSLKDKTQPDYGMNIFDKLSYKEENLENGSPENLDALDVQSFFYATVRCAAFSYEEQRKLSRGDVFKLYLLPACLTPPLVTKQQLEWWEAVCKFHGGTARENFAKLRVVLQRGIETVRLLGCHGMSVTMIVHLAQTFNERLKEVEKLVEEGQQRLEVMINSLQGRVLHYWKEGLSLLTKIQRNMPIRMPKERMFSDTDNNDCDSNQVQYLIDQAKFAMATIAMKKGQFEEAKEQFEKLNQPLSSYNLSQIYRKMSDNLRGDNPDVISQKTALLESALDALYLSHDRLKGDKNDELSRKIPADIDDVVNQIERLQTSGAAIVDSILQTENDESSDEAASFSTPKGPGHKSYTESPSFIQPYDKEHSTPAVKGKSPGVALNFSEVVRQRPRPSPERLEAKIWALEHKQQTIMELLRDIKDRSNEMNRVIREVRDEQETYKEVVKQMREFMTLHTQPGHGQFINPQLGFPPYGYPPQPAPPQPAVHQSPWMPAPSNFGYTLPQRPSFGIPNRFPVPSHQNDIVEDDIYHVDGEYYEDDGSQPFSTYLNTPDSQLEQNWPFGQRTGLEGKATVTYSPQGRPIPQPGFFAQALRGQALQYAYQQPGVQTSLQKPGQPRNPLNIQQPSANSGIGPGFFSQQPQLSVSSSQLPGTRGSDMFQTGVSSSQPTALIAALQGSSTTNTTVSMPPNAVATSSMMAKPNLIPGTNTVTGQQLQGQGQIPNKTLGQGQPVFGSLESRVSTASDSSMPLFGSLVAAAKSPDAGPLTSFSGLKPTTYPAGSSIPSFGTLASQGTDTNIFKPQEGFTGFHDANRPLFIKGSSPGKSPTKSPSKYGTDDDHHDEYEPNVEFKPVIDLPDLVDVKTGEEEEEKLFGHRGKLFRYDPETKQWKERGVGEMKILKHKETKQVRILMRREQVLKLCANHYLSKDLKLAPMPTSDKAWCWVAMDYSEEELKTEKLCIRFKTEEIANQFKEVFEKCQAELDDDMPAIKPKPPTPKTTPTGQPAIKDLFKPKIGSWTCNTCLVTNDSTTVKCPACGDSKLGTKPEVTKPGVTIPNMAAKSADSKGSTQPSLKDMFKPKAGAWSCGTCCVSNNADILKCACCETLKPGVKPEDVKDDTSESTNSGFKFGTTEQTDVNKNTGGFSFGTMPTQSSGFKFGDTTITKPAETSGFKFGDMTSKPAEGLGFKFGQPKLNVEKTEPDSTTTESGGFKFGEKAQFGDTGGFKFGNQTVMASQDVTKTTGQEKETTVAFAKPKAVPVKPSKTETKSDTKTGISFVPPSDGNKPGFPFGLKTEGFNFGKKEETPSTQKDEGAVFRFKITDTHSDDETKEPEVRTGTFVFKPSEDPASSSSEQSPFTVTSSKVEDKGDSSPFKFTFTVKPTGSATRTDVKSPKSPEVDPDGMYVNKEGEDDHIYFEPLIKLDRVEVVTGEEDEAVLYEHRAKLYRFVNGEWKERGLGDIKILENKESKQIRLLMRREKILKVCCNHYITSDIDLKPMPKSDGKAWVWSAMDCSEGEPQHEKLSIRFKTADIANEFKAAFDSAKEKIVNESSTTDTPKRSDQLDKTSQSPGIAARKLFDEDVSDVIIIKEEKATKEQIEKARKFKLPDHFYLYESKPPCPGCIGCVDDDGEPKFKSPPKDETKQVQDTATSGGSIFEGAATSIGGSTGGSVFGVTSTPGGSIFGGASQKQDDKSASGTFGGGLFGKESGGSTESKSTEGTGVFGSGASGAATFGFLANQSGNSGSANLFGSGSTGSVFGKSSSGSQFSFASLAAHSGDSPTTFAKDDSKPFKWAGAGQTLFKSAGGETGDGDDDNEDGDEVEQSHDPHFEPIVPLPDLVEVKTGEEDEDPVFCHRAKLFRFDKDANQWKEKGIGEMKILRCKFTGRYRLLLRREQVYKLACNHLLTPDLSFKPLATSETSYCWVAEDFAENEAKVEQFAVKFKSIDLARQFIEKIEECQEELRNMPPPSEDKTPVQCSDEGKDNNSASGTSKQKDTSEVDDKDDDDDDEEEDDDDDDYETEEEEEVIFEKRVTFSSREKGEDKWTMHGLGDLKILYDEDVNGNRVTMVTDKDDKVCNHLIAKECTISVNAKQRNCEWTAVDFSTDEAVRREFRAQFGSTAAAEEFQKTFEQGRSLAVDSDISERDMMMTTQEMSVPEVHSHSADPNE